MPIRQMGLARGAAAVNLGLAFPWPFRPSTRHLIAPRQRCNRAGCSRSARKWAQECVGLMLNVAKGQDLDPLACLRQVRDVFNTNPTQNDRYLLGAIDQALAKLAARSSA